MFCVVVVVEIEGVDVTGHKVFLEPEVICSFLLLFWKCFYVLRSLRLFSFVMFTDDESMCLKVQRAIEYAREAHAGQFRRTGEPYIAHCIETAKILAALIPPQQGKRVGCQP